MSAGCWLPTTIPTAPWVSNWASSSQTRVGAARHINVSGAGVLAAAPNPEAAIAFLEYLTTDEAQAYFAGGNNEYPVVAGIEIPGPIASFGTFDEDSVNANALGANNAEAVRIFDRAGWQ